MVAWYLSDLREKSLVYYKDRQDLSVYIQDGIDLATSYFSQKLRVREMMTTATLTPDVNGVCTLPDDFIEIITVTEDLSYGVPLDSMTTVGVGASYYSGVAGQSLNYAITGSTLKLYPGSSNDVLLVYYAAIPDLSTYTGVLQNWLLTKFPLAYLDYCRMFAADIADDPPTEARYAGKVDVWIDTINERDMTARYSRMTTDLSDEMIVP